MKATLRILAVAMCVCLVLGTMTFVANADTPTGSITIENQSGSNASVAGKKLNLFKIFDATSSGSNISYQWVNENGTNLYESFFFGTDGMISEEIGTIHDVVEYINSLKDDSFAFSQMAAKLHTYIHTQNISPNESVDVADDATSYTFDNLELGYYLIYDATVLPSDSPAVRSAAMLAHPGENKVIKLKADRPHIEKYVDDSDNDTPDWKIATTASIGETVTFRLVTMIPDHDLYGDDYTFIITDSMDDTLELDTASIKVNLISAAATDEGTTPAATTYDIITDASALDAGDDFKIEFTKITDLQQNTVVEVIYEAKVLANAEPKNNNTATLVYSNDPNNKDSKGEVSSTASVLLWKFILTKFAEDASGTATITRLPGAEFQIFAKDDLDTPLAFTTETVTYDNGVQHIRYVFDPENGTETAVKTLDEGDDGKSLINYAPGGYLGQIVIFGLGEGTYVIRETKAPDGYQIAKGVFEFTLNDTVGPSGFIANANISQATRTETPGHFTRVMVQEGNQTFFIGITNAPGSALPETGGIGTTIFTVGGIIMMAGALAFFTSRKRSSAV